MNDELLATALLGTNRRAADPTALLESAALEHAFRRGAAGTTTAVAPAPADDDPRYLLPAAAAARLDELLRLRSVLLTEWLDVACGKGFRARDVHTADLLHYALTRPADRDRLLQLAGARGRWLAGQNPEWATLYRDSTDTTTWAHGTSAERRLWLTDLRARDPAAARAALTDSWRLENGEDRLAFVRALATNVTAADEPFLDAALDDKRKDVRAAAAELLRALPDSAYARRMAERVQRWVRVDRRMLRTRVVLELPAELDATARRDGIVDQRTASMSTAESWLRQSIAATPLTIWEAMFGSLDSAVSAPIERQYEIVFLGGWRDAAIAQHDSDWAQALMYRSSFAAGGLPKVLLPHQAARFVLAQSGNFLMHAGTLEVLGALAHPWPLDVSEHVVGLLVGHAQRYTVNPSSRADWPRSAEHICAEAGLHLAPDVAALLRRAAESSVEPLWQKTFGQIGLILRRRSKMLEELE